MERTGGCFCGYVRYRAGGAASQETCCHCSICRRTSGAPYVAWFTVPAASFQVVAGNPTDLRSSVHGTRTFCPRCGTPLTFRSTHAPGELDVTTCSLDDPGILPPKDHTWTRAQLPWIRLGDRLPTYPEARPAGKAKTKRRAPRPGRAPRKRQQTRKPRRTR
jgi:hypothetical protein